MLGISRRHGQMLDRSRDAEGVKRKGILPKRTIKTPNAYSAKESRDGITINLPVVVNA